MGRNECFLLTLVNTMHFSLSFIYAIIFSYSFIIIFCPHSFLVGGFNPFEKYESNWIISPRIRIINQTCFKPPPRFFVWENSIQNNTPPPPMFLTIPPHIFYTVWRVFLFPQPKRIRFSHFRPVTTLQTALWELNGRCLRTTQISWLVIVPMTDPWDDCIFTY